MPYVATCIVCGGRGIVPVVVGEVDGEPDYDQDVCDNCGGSGYSNKKPVRMGEGGIEDVKYSDGNRNGI